MSIAALVQYAVFILIVTLLVRPVGAYLAKVFAGERTLLYPVLWPVKRTIYLVTGVDPAVEMDWKGYAAAFIRFGATGAIVLYIILRTQEELPWFQASQGATPMTRDLAMNTSVSFATTTPWQAYAGETSMSYFSQMAGLTAQNFLAGAAGLAVGMAFIRGFARQSVAALGNFWVDITRAVLWVLLPVCVVGTLVLVWRGVPANLNDYTEIQTAGGETGLILQGPVATLEVIKSLGTNGGGFFNANGAHPFENPTPLTNILEMLVIAVVPAAFTYTFGRMVGRRRQGWLLYGVMVILFAAGLILCGWAEDAGNPRLDEIGAAQDGADHPGGNMEGKEIRFGIGGSVLTAIATSNGATGSYNAMHDSFTALGGLVPLVNMMLGEMVFGGLGTGLFSMLGVVLLGVFLSGLMVGRTPEFLGKRLGPAETRLIVIYSVLAPLAILVPTAIVVVTSEGLAGLTTNSGAHGLSEVIYAFASSMTNNGQNFAGLSANSPFYNSWTALAMIAGRFGLGLLAHLLAGHVAAQQRRERTAGTPPTDTPLFAGVIVGTAAIAGALSFFPALALGPVFDHFSS